MPQTVPATDSASELHDLIGDDATATFEADPKFVDADPAANASTENVNVQAADEDDVDEDEEFDDEEDEDDEEDDEEDDDEDDVEDDDDDDDEDDDDIDTDQVAKRVA